MKRIRILSVIAAALVSMIFSDLSTARTQGVSRTVKILRIRLYFENNRSKITVKKRQPKLFAQAEIHFKGNGILAGYWEADGRITSRFSQHVSSTGSTTTIYQRTSRPLLTQAPGSHRVRAVITRPGKSIPFPVALYFVTGHMYNEPWIGR